MPGRLFSIFLLIIAAPASAQEPSGPITPAARQAPAEPAPVSSSGLAGALASPVAATRELPDVIEYTLDNGLRVVLQQVPNRRHVAICMTYHTGWRDSPPGYSGLAHLTEHLMFEPTSARNEHVLSALERAGATEFNGATHHDDTEYYEVLPRERLEWGLWLEAERMAHMLAGLDEAQVAHQRRIVQHESRQRGRHRSIGRLSAVLYEHLFPPGHPYRRLYEHPEDVSAIRLEHVQWFFQVHYGPANATLSVAGTFDPANARAMIERYFGPIEASAPPPSRRYVPLPEIPERYVEYEAHTDFDELHVAWVSPPYFAHGDAALDVVAELLAGTPDAPLSRALAELTVALHVRQESHELGSLFRIRASAAPGHHTGEILDAIDRVLAQLRREPFTEAEVARARARWVARYGGPTDDLGWLARTVGTRTASGVVPTSARQRERYGAIRAHDVSGAIRDWLTDHRLVVFVAKSSSAPIEGRVRSVRDVGPR